MGGREVPHAGWYLLAFADELTSELTPVSIGAHRLMLVAEGAGERQSYGLYDSTCPHRGANLAVGGRLSGRCVVCPFHGKQVMLGHSSRPWWVRRHQTLRIGPLIFARLGIGAGDCGFASTLPEAIGDWRVATAIKADVATRATLVVENAFDAEHFVAVHSVPKVSPMTARTHRDGYLQVAGDFRTLSNPWLDPSIRQGLQRILGPGAARWSENVSAFRASAFSPTLVVTTFGAGSESPVIITGSVPTDENHCEVRVAVAAPRSFEHLDRVVTGARKAIAEDVSVWDHLDLEAPTRYDDPADEPVRRFHQFCSEFPLASPTSPDCPGDELAAHRVALRESHW